jgi:hypothetical protein
MVVDVCNSNYLGGIGRRIAVQGWSMDKKYEILSKQFLPSSKKGMA